MSSTGGTSGYPDTVEKIYDEFLQRRCGSLRALTSDSEDFFKQCDPESENLCLYGNVDGTWTVALPAEMVPAEVPEPAVGINFARDGMASRGLWLALVFFHAAKLTRAEKRKLFDMCTQLPSLYETITGKANIVYGPKNKPGMKRPGGKVGAVAAAKGEKANLPKKTKKEDEEETEPGVHSSPAPGAKKLTNTDQQLLANLKGRHVQLYWPDDNLWYDAEVLDFNSRNKSAKVKYATGDLEQLNIDELIVDGHVYVRKQ